MHEDIQAEDERTRGSEADGKVHYGLTYGIG
jgi:hypothetical protein